ncbi:MAG: cysteine hydrolase [bacterium]|nr:cysteine hydrolase [bacterium]
MVIDTDALTLRHLDPQATLPAQKTALVIIDMMERFCDPSWLAGGNESRAQWFQAELDAVIPNLRTTLDAFRSQNALIVHVVNAKWTETGREVVPYQRDRDYELFDSDPMSVIAPLAPRPGEIIVRKVASSAFTGTGLDFLLRNAGIEHLVLSGQYGNACVFYTLIQGREFGFNNYWMEDSILYGSETDKHLFRALVGSRWAKLATTEEIAGALGTT